MAIEQSQYRQQMIRETSAFVEWALAQGGAVPYIPRRRVDQGGFTEIMRHPGAKAAAAYWWARVLSDPSLEGS